MAGKPAARITDLHTCPQFSGLVPHVGGPVVQGSPDVTINCMPAARTGDTALCNGPSDSVAQGSPTVFINGKPAARMGDKTAHGGVITAGSLNVFIGDRGGRVSPALCPVQAAQKETAFFSDRK